MNTKLTLKLDKNVIDKAKIYAADKKISLSWIFENYLKAITAIEKPEEKNEIKISDFVNNIPVGHNDISSDFDYKKDRQNYLVEKYK